VPGQPNHIWLQADQPGSYLGACSEFCGSQHAWMHFLIVAEPDAEFETWQQAQLRPAATPAGDAATQGHDLFMRSTCVNCHAINGTLAKGSVAPDLTHFASRKRLGSGVADNTPENLRRWLANPQQFKPGVKMPDYHFTDEQLTQLVAYFQTLR
jgi:cytochrome c oxidase subunit 2